MRTPVEFAQLEWDSQDQPRCSRFQDIYFYTNDNAERNGLAESRYVFLSHNQLEERWQQLANQADTPSFVIAETGFGTGLNFLATWQLWEKCAIKNAKLHFVSIEKHPLRPKDLARALNTWPELQSYSQQLLTQYPDLLCQGFFSLSFPHSNLFLTLIIDDVDTALQQCLQSSHPQYCIPTGQGVDAWYLDGFAPRLNPAMWSSSVIQSVAQLSHAGTTFATFTAAGDVQRHLKSCGFSVEKVKGFGSKRDMLRGMLTKPFASPTINARMFYDLPWSVTQFNKPEKNAIVIGAGLAGCHTARALAERGWQVIVIDSADSIAAGASGNAQGVVYAKLSADDDPLAQFNLSALNVAAQSYTPMWENDSNIGQHCGVLQLAYNNKEERLRDQCLDLFGFASSGIATSTVEFVNAKRASELAGVELHTGGLFFPNLGWINPPSLCQLLIDHPSITIKLNTAITTIEWQESKYNWKLIDADNNTVGESPTVVIANAFNAHHFQQTNQLPLKKIRGQVSYLPTTKTIEMIKTVVCGESYIAPAMTSSPSIQIFGATFDLQHQDLALRSQDHQYNLKSVLAIAPVLKSHLAIDPSQLDGRAQFRCTTPDYLPVVGPVHQHQQFISDYAKLRVNAKAPLHTAGKHWPGLFINVGHGSRGLAYTPLCARILAAQINGDPLPISRTLAQALHPGRFTIRGLMRRQF